MSENVRSPLRRLVPLLLVLTMVGPLTLNILQPAMPSLVRAFGASRETIQLTLSLYILGMAASQFIGGPLADRFGRRPVVLCGLIIFVLASVAASLVSSVEALIAARIVQALGATMSLAISRTIIGDVSDRATTARILAYVTMAMVLAPMAAPNIGAALDAYFGWRAIFVFCAVFGIAIALAMVFFLFETRPVALANTTYREVGRRTLSLAKNTAFLRYVGISSFATACFFIFIGGSPHLIIESMGRSPSEFGVWYILLGIGYALGNFTVTRTSHISPHTMIRIGGVLLLIGACAMVALAMVPIMHPLAVFGPAICITYSNGLVLPNSMAAGIQTDPNAGGAASGLMGFAQMFVGAVASFLVSKLPGETALTMALMMVVCAITALLVQGRTASAKSR